ncbi:hypothetical protein HMPREF3099_04855 [Kytococcus sp. HMSC28H12]|nr:hypothetical protein HMPREF3099_04855 [Kytococcus sp. HMSC28H12]
MTSPLVQRMQPFGTSIFAEMTQRAVAADAVNLGQGAPDSGTPPELIEWAHEAMLEGRNQYPPFWDVPALREAVAAHQGRFHGLAVDPAQVLVTVGATEALTASILALVEPGEEVVVIEPAYDSYAAAVASGVAGAAGAAGSGAGPRDAGGGVLRPHRDGGGQHPAQPDRCAESEPSDVAPLQRR